MQRRSLRSPFSSMFQVNADTAAWGVATLASTDGLASSLACHSARRAAREPPSRVHDSLQSATGDKALDRGELTFATEGERMHGSFVLVRLNDKGSGAGKSWMLIKHRDPTAVDASGGGRAAEDRSVASGRSLAEVGPPHAKPRCAPPQRQACAEAPDRPS